MTDSICLFLIFWLPSSSVKLASSTRKANNAA